MKTQRQLINEALKSKSISVKKMCEDLDIHYGTYRSCVSRMRLTGDNCLLISEYLDIDLKTLMKAPAEKAKKKDEAK